MAKAKASANTTFIVQASLTIITYNRHLRSSLTIVTYDRQNIFFCTGHRSHCYKTIFVLPNAQANEPECFTPSNPCLMYGKEPTLETFSNRLWRTIDI